MRLSIFTPTHNPQYIRQLAESLEDQDFDEWVILANGLSSETVRSKFNRISPTLMSKVNIYEIPATGPVNIGALKKIACDYCTGDIFMEVDHDDMLMPGACAKVKDVFAIPDVDFVYSDCVRFQQHSKDIVTAPEPYRADYGWRLKNCTTIFGELPYHPSFEPNHLSVSRIWFAPDHLRAWRADFYRKIGGHNPAYDVLDDHELMIRTYLQGRTVRIPKPLYLYRVHEQNTWSSDAKLQKIQTGTMELYHQNIEALALRWCALNDLAPINLGGGSAYRPGYIHHEHPKTPRSGSEANWATWNLDQSWDLATGEAGLLLINDVMEHVADKRHFITEAHRVLAHGGMILSQTPSTDGRGAFSDPTHVAYYNEESFRYYTEASMAAHLPWETKPKFQEVHRATGPMDEHGRCWVFWHAAALKGNEILPGYCGF